MANRSVNPGQCLRKEASDEPLIVKRELLEEIFDVYVELIVPEITPAGKDAVNAVLLAGEEGLEILVGLGVVHVHKGVQARADVEHDVRGISEDDHPQGAQPERGATPCRTQYQEARKHGQYQQSGQIDIGDDAQKRKTRQPDDDRCLNRGGPALEQVGEDQDEDSGHGEQALQMHAGAEKEQVHDENQQAVAIPVLGRAVPARMQGQVECQDGEEHGQRVDFRLGGICPEGGRECGGQCSDRAAGQDGDAVG